MESNIIKQFYRDCCSTLRTIDDEFVHPRAVEKLSRDNYDPSARDYAHLRNCDGPQFIGVISARLSAKAAVRYERKRDFCHLGFTFDNFLHFRRRFARLVRVVSLGRASGSSIYGR